MMPRNVSSATTSPPNAITNVLPRNAWMYGAARRIHWTNARVVAEWAAGVALGFGGIEWRGGVGSVAARARSAPIITPGRRVAGGAQRIIPDRRRRVDPAPHRLELRVARSGFPMASPLLANLNPEQLAAVTLPHQSALILAGAGSGKTRVLTTRIAWLLATGQATPLSILAVTFTNKAAKEMLVRLSAMTPVHTRGMWIGTFHGLCNRMLRAHYRDADLPQLFQIMDTQDQLALIKRMYRAHGIDDERFPPRQLQ